MFLRDTLGPLYSKSLPFAFRSWRTAIQRRWWRSTLPASTSCPSLTSCWMTLGTPTRGLASRSAPSVSSARHAPYSRWRTGSQQHPHAEIRHPLPSLPAKQKTCVFLLFAEKIHSSPEKKCALPKALSWKRWPGETTPRPCRARITWLWVTSGKGHLMPWRTVAHFQQQREDPLTPSPILPRPSPPTKPPSLDAPGAAVNTTTEVLLCRITKHSRCYKKCFW